MKHKHGWNTDRKYAKTVRMVLPKSRIISHFPFHCHPNILQHACITFIIRKRVIFLNKTKIQQASLQSKINFYSKYSFNSHDEHLDSKNSENKVQSSCS